ncbi:MAG: sigma 54-interacting transcriptional regulator [Bradymonadaceae bacterium]|nr:sigma 54-interacting transcriptional regulator [Lujinxingiaceae bacterium]
MESDVLKHPERETHNFFGMVTGSPQMTEFFELVRRVARADVSVLIRGETGTGKELAAQAIHRLSGRSDKAFHAVNCATFTAELLASELFGHVRGAFTGAVRERKGLFELADEGIIFLDEIAEIPFEVQARLLRVLQEQRFVPVGGTQSKEVDVRIVSATNKALRHEVAEGRFREDLMYRIRVVPIFLPPLVDRQGDVELLAWHFIDKLNARQAMGRTIRAIEAAAYEAMLAYRWPGNVRELMNVIEYAFVMGDGELLRLGDLTPEIRGEPPSSRDRWSEGDVEQQRRQIVAALKASQGRRDEAAERLGMSRTTLWRRMKELGIGHLNG